jgi:uncharacterized membrane protein YphA (DoxX/SURF4 family)
MTVAAFVARVIVGLVFLVAAVAKARSIDPFVRSIRDVTALAGARTGRTAATGLATTIVALELTLAVLLLTGALPLPASVGGLGLVGLFVFVSVLALVRRREVECNCFGPSATTLGRETLFRAALLAIPLGLYAVAGRSSWPHGTADWLSSLALVTGGGLLLYWAIRMPTLVGLVRVRKRWESRKPRSGTQARPLQRLRMI